MASWLFGASKLKSDNITEAEPKLTESTTNPEPTTNTPTTSRLMYDLQPAKPKPEENVKVTSMLDNIPFVLSSQINMNTNSYTDSLEDTKKCLMSVKKLLDSDFYNYDFSNDRKLHSKMMAYKHKDNVCPEQLHKNDTQWLHRICFNVFRKGVNK